MVLNKSEIVETMTILRLVRLTMSLDSSWYELSVFSHKGSRWEEHCTGDIKESLEQMISSTLIASNSTSRKISSSS